MTETTDRKLQFQRVPCPLCGGDDSVLHVRLRDYFCGLPGEFTFERCRSCRHVFLNPQPTRETIHLAYPDDYGPHRVSETPVARNVSDGVLKDFSLERPWYARQPFRSIPGLRRLYGYLMDDRSEAVPHVETSHPCAAELGFGSGDFLHRLLDAGWNVRGYDASTLAVDQALARGLPVEHGTVEEIVLPEGTFDAVFAWMTLEHLHDVRGATLKVRKSLKPGGSFCFSVPNFGCWEPHFLGRHWLGYDAPRHLHQFTPRSLRRILREAGFDSVEVIHQRSLRYVYGSLGASALDRNPRSKLGAALMHAYRNEPRLLYRLAMAPFSIALALLRQSGRLTVVARTRAAASEGSRT